MRWNQKTKTSFCKSSAVRNVAYTYKRLLWSCRLLNIAPQIYSSSHAWHTNNIQHIFFISARQSQRKKAYDSVTSWKVVCSCSPKAVWKRWIKHFFVCLQKNLIQKYFVMSEPSDWMGTYLEKKERIKKVKESLEGLQIEIQCTRRMCEERTLLVC